MSKSVAAGSVVAAVLLGTVLLCWNPAGDLNATDMQDLSSVKKVQISLPIGGESLKNAKPTLLELQKELSMLKFVVAKYGVGALGGSKDSKEAKTKTAKLAAQIKTMQKTLTALQGQVRSHSKKHKGRSTTYHLAKQATMSDLAQTSSKDFTGSVHRVQVSLPIGGESLKNAKPTLKKLNKELTMLKFVVAKYGVSALGNKDKATQTKLATQIKAMQATITSLSKQVGKAHKKQHTTTYHMGGAK